MKRELALLGISGFAGLAWVVACIAIFIGFDGQFNSVVALLFSLFVYSSVMLWRTILSSNVAPLNLMFWIFHANFLFLPALSQAAHRTFFWSSYDAYQQGDLLFACFVIIAGLVAFCLGSCLAQAQPGALHKHAATTPFLIRPLRSTWVVQFALLVIMMGLAGFVMKMGMAFFLVLRDERAGFESQTQTGLLVNLPRALSIGILLFSSSVVVQHWKQTRSLQIPMLLILCAALGLNAIINYPLGLARFWFFGLIISLVWVVSPLHSVKLRSAFVISITLLQFTLFPWFSQITRGSGLLGFDLNAIREYMHHGDFDGYQSIVNSLIYIRESGLAHGKSLLSVLLFFLPRSLWDKAEPLGASAAEHMGYGFTNLSSPIYGEFYADFGLVSLLLGMALTGYGLKVLDAYYNHLVQQHRLGTGTLLVGVFAGYLVILLRGSLLAVISSIATLFILLLFLSWMATRAAARKHFHHYPAYQ